MTSAGIDAVLFDFGGVITTSPFDAFARYEREAGLPHGLIRRINATNAQDNAWAKLERSQVDVATFCRLFEAEAAALGHQVSGEAVMACLSGDVRPEMVEAVRRCRAHLKVGCITNNLRRNDSAEEAEVAAAWYVETIALFDVVVESSKEGIRKPEPRIYEMACERLGVDPSGCVFLDDLGVNLKPARAMGMTTIKVESAEQAIAELEAVLGLALR